jgi:hypothetical protein
MGFSFLAGDPAGGGVKSDADAVADALAAERWLDEGGGNEPPR